MKKLLLGLALTFCLNANAQSFFATNNLTAGAHTVFTTGKILESLTLYSTNTLPTLVYLYDGAITNVTGVFTNYTVYTTNVVSTVVTTAGITNTYTNVMLRYVPATVAAATNNALPRYTLVVPPSSEVLTYALSPFASVAKGLTVSNALTGLSFVLQYRNP
jgi:hypothetical protein